MHVAFYPRGCPCTPSQSSFVRLKQTTVPLVMPCSTALPPLFSVIIPAYNCEHTLDETIRSVLSQSCKDFEIIVVDDGSSDRTPAIARAHKDVRLLQQDNQGPGAARNRGASEAKGEFLAFLDGDDLWFPWTLANYRETIVTHRCDFLSGTAIEFTERAPSAHSGTLVTDSYDTYLTAGSRGLWIGTCGVAIRRTKFLAAGGFATNRANAEDSDLWLRLGDISPFVRVSQPFSFAYRRSPDSATGNHILSTTGAFSLLNNEISGKYPGGISRKHNRDCIIATHVRPVAVECARRGDIRNAWKLYWASARMQCRHWRVKFVLGAPLLFLFHFTRRRIA